MIDTITALRNNGVTQTTLKQINYKLREIARNTIINDPKKVKGYIATAKNQITDEPLSKESRNKIARADKRIAEMTLERLDEQVKAEK